MAGTSGLDAGTAALVIAAINGGTAFTVTTPFKTRFFASTRSANNGADGTEFTVSGGYPTGGVAGPATPWQAATTTTTGAQQLSNATTGAVTVTNAPAGTWGGCVVYDAVPKALWYAPVSPTKTINAGDTVTVPAGQFTTTLG
jgi:hypothetical protein